MRNILLDTEGVKYKLIEREWEEYHGITAALITLNEEDNIVEFLEHIKPLVKRIVMIDGGSTDKTVELATPYVDTLRVIPFTGHFANQKNEALKLCYTDWVLFLDPDERLSDNLYKQIPELIEQDKYDCYKFPRIEFIDGKPGGECGVEGYISQYPDYQARLFRMYCRFIRPTHEEVVGVKNVKEIRAKSETDILHYKKMGRHIERNSSYPIFSIHYIHEWGKPGEQVKDTIVQPEDLTKYTGKNVDQPKEEN